MEGLTKLEAYKHLEKLVARELKEASDVELKLRKEILSGGADSGVEYRERCVAVCQLRKEAMYIHEAISELERPTRTLLAEQYGDDK